MTTAEESSKIHALLRLEAFSETPDLAKTKKDEKEIRGNERREIVQLEPSKGKPNQRSRPSGPFSSRLSGLPVGFSIPIQRGASEPNYYDSSPLDSVGPFDLPPFSMIPRYLGRAHCVLSVEGDTHTSCSGSLWWGFGQRGPRTPERSSALSLFGIRDAINYSSMSGFFTEIYTFVRACSSPSIVDHTCAPHRESCKFENESILR